MIAYQTAIQGSIAAHLDKGDTMATFSEFLRVADMTIHDKTSSKRMLEIIKILRKNHAVQGLTPERAVNILQDLGPTYVKVGQLASNQTDILPREYCEAFAKLCDDVRPMDFNTVITCINTAYGHPYTEVFESIEEKPLGAASIAQVHKAKLKDGTVVAVKVRRPGIVEEMAADITMMKHALAMAEFATTHHEELLLSLDRFVDELERTTAQEVDFTVELNNLIRFHKEIADQKGVTSPKPYPAFSNDAVLVMEFVKGVEISQVAELKKQGLDVDELCQRLAQSYITQVLDYGYFHADPHAGNIIIRNGEIVWIDLGMTGTITSSEKQVMRRIFTAITTKNPYELKDAALGLVDSHGGEIDHGKLLDLMENILETFDSSSLASLQLGDLMQEMVEALREQHLVLKNGVTMLVRGFTTIGGVLEEISPKTSLVSIISQHVIKQTVTPEHISQRIVELTTASIQSAEDLTKIPSALNNILDMVARGQLSLKGNLDVSERSLATIYTIGNRLALALIAAGLFLGSSIVCTTGMEPKLLGVPLIGFFGYIGAFLLSAYVVVRSIRDRHHIVNHLKVEE